ncbi:type II toxin-antitoxin system HicA family toxin [Mucilaginibacter lappiensis]|uniref:Putative RNA binding protein YcfA (HicA-like mRNA interferase family) n=1 Tax=Mucilaginibacter lappiensis TaxID=354630 RepID=A0A841JIB7_9SPHI|nr:type II toxin-antitoxin system HicA family toxin [Mucilaginibacter lappiensis]MBB6130244.1 putative RNA binding protein YcfA (HicA-like mRNA interferase family) [Mucilaginibacter lappiensis]
MSPKIPRDVSGKALIKVLSKYGYGVIRQTGSHVRLSITINDEAKNITVPNHDSIKLGTLMAILNEVAAQLNISRDVLISKL